MIEVRLDLMMGPQTVNEDWKTLHLPCAPNTGEYISLGKERLVVVGRSHQITEDGTYLARLLVQRLKGLVAASSLKLPR